MLSAQRFDELRLSISPLAQALPEARDARAMRPCFGPARETLAALHVAQAWAYYKVSDEVTFSEVDQFVATLVRFARKAQ